MSDALLSSFGLSRSAYLGGGAEAEVFALDTARVLRIARTGAEEGAARLRGALLQQVRTPAHFAVPTVLDYGAVEGVIYTIETRLAGQPMDAALGAVRGSARQDLILSYLQASMDLSGLLKPSNGFGDLARTDPVTSCSFHTYLKMRAQASLQAGHVPFDVETVLAAIPQPEAPALVHLDYCPANVLCEGGKISAVLDFGSATIAGDGMFNPIVAQAYLSPLITASATSEDPNWATEWLDVHVAPTVSAAVRQWVACYWAFCSEVDDPGLYHWCQNTLGITSQ